MDQNDKAKLISQSLPKTKKPNNKQGQDPLELKGLTPDELANKILGIETVEPDFEDDADPDVARFWFEAAYGDELKAFFKEKNRIKILVAALMKHGYTEEEIREIFIRVAKARLVAEKLDLEAAQKREIIVKKISWAGVLLVSLFMIYQMILRTHQIALDREKKRIEKVKTFICKTERPPFYMKKEAELDWYKVVVFNKPVSENFYLKTENYPAVIDINGSATVELDKATELKISEVKLDSNKERIVEVHFEIQCGKISWNLPEKSKINLFLKAPKWSLKIKYGIGKFEKFKKPERIAVLEGKTIFSEGGLPIMVNGLMELLLENPIQKRLYEHY